jgi:hypothetical protein
MDFFGILFAVSISTKEVGAKQLKNQVLSSLLKLFQH